MKTPTMALKVFLNVLLLFINQTFKSKMMKTFINYLLLVGLLLGCKSADIFSNYGFDLKLNESKTIELVNLKVLELQDNRCPMGKNARTTCAVAGSFNVKLQIKRVDTGLLQTVDFCMGACSKPNVEGFFEVNGRQYKLILVDTYDIDKTPFSDYARFKLL